MCVCVCVCVCVLTYLLVGVCFDAARLPAPRAREWGANMANAHTCAPALIYTRTHANTHTVRVKFGKCTRVLAAALLKSVHTVQGNITCGGARYTMYVYMYVWVCVCLQYLGVTCYTRAAQDTKPVPRSCAICKIVYKHDTLVYKHQTCIKLAR